MKVTAGKGIGHNFIVIIFRPIYFIFCSFCIATRIGRLSVHVSLMKAQTFAAKTESDNIML